MKWLKDLWNWIVGKARALLDSVLDAVIEQAKAIAADKDLAALALDCVQAAAKEGLTGQKAWVKARDRLVAALKESGIELAGTAIDTLLQNIYSAWKSLGKPEA